ncbi:metal-dependent hydrolase [Candidatus Fukatsuia symbiotica]|uniref:Metal-dependent hydrolase n=1 Tax=Candidatus Fukatsuia symbiotica TaxID=1878942 RepID=A0A2U8IAU3_9GAMM|nr:metal-dependent hydrolase [Candidatus Fukatsuia symbiotica]AWK15375.1 metal-dependent hydrolase [Candidatus Fukatsuia symbiotica]MEA9444691.1 metal-dependent hydrolase [Candidatus Fukatsuia symbiotica]
MLLIDSHCHLDCLDYQNLHNSVDDVLAKAAARDVGFILAVATTLSGFKTMTAFIGERENVAFSCGVHPLNLKENYEYQQLLTLAAASNVLALGETGLDYHYQKDNVRQQRESFCWHIAVARQLKKPVIVHTRDAREDTLAILQNERAQDCGGVLHCFTEDQAMAEKLLDLGFYLSFSGIVTFRNAQSLRDIVSYIPLDRLLIETDSPYLAPVPYRGKENQPAYVREVAEYIAELKGVTVEKLAEVTTDNFIKLFHLEGLKRDVI